MPQGQDVKSRRWTIRDLAYVAGLADGEGSFSAGRPSATQVSPRFSMSLTDLQLLEWCAATFGGTICKHSAAAKWGNKKQAWVWSIIGQPLCDFVEAIAPYLKLKRRQAWLCWQIQTVRCWAANNRPGVRGWQEKNPNILKFYAGCWQTLHRLNQRGVPVAN